MLLFTRPDRIWRNDVPHFAKPAEGSWTEQYPDLGTGPVSYEDSISPEHYELERKAIFSSHLAERGSSRAAGPQRELFHQGDRRRRHLDHRRQGHRRRGAGLPQHLPPSWQQARLERLSRRGDQRDLPAVHLQVPRLALRHRRATSPSSSRSRSSSISTRTSTGSVGVQVEIWQGFIFVNLNPDNTDLAAGLPRGVRAPGIEGYPFDKMTAGLQVPRRRRQ